MNSIFKSKIVMLLMAAMAMTSFSSCGGDDDDSDTGNGGNDKPGTELVKKTVMLSRKTAYGNDWIYFSFKEGKELAGITEENHMENLDWDIAFNRFNIRTNGGLSGKGQGGALDTDSKDMEAVKAVPEKEFVLDVKAMITESFTGSGITECESTLNPCMAKAIEFQGPPPTYTPSNHIYVVKTADGKYAKIKVLGYHNNEGKSGFVSFEYVYQPNGSRNF